MNKIDIGKSGLLASEISLGCMRIAGLDDAAADALLAAAWESGIDFYDHRGQDLVQAIVDWF